jgi:hypothetical protein
MTIPRTTPSIRFAVLFILIPAYISTLASFDDHVKHTFALLTSWKSPSRLSRIQQLKSRYAPLKKSFPPNTRVGYVSDDDIKSAKSEDFRLTQYVLAPTLLTLDVQKRPQFILCSFEHSDEDCLLSLPAGYILEEDLRNGVRLYRLISSS